MLTREHIENIKFIGEKKELANAVQIRISKISRIIWEHYIHDGRFKGVGIKIMETFDALDEMKALLEELQTLDPDNT